jgi:hypothetical protein
MSDELSPVLNPLTGDPLPDEAASFVRELRTVRHGSRRAMRSGHPGRRAEAIRVNNLVPGSIRTVYLQYR